MNEKQKERQRLKQLGIVFVTAILPDQFPAHLLNTFHSIRSFRKIDFSTFDSSDPLLPPEKVLWRSEIKNRARDIVDIAVTLIEDAPSEMDVRLRLEQEVLMRFNRIIECPSCKKRLWRSEVEAEVELPDLIAKSLLTRRLARPPCQCPPGERKSRLNTLFSSRGDEMVCFDSFRNSSEEDAKKRLSGRRPDRILGFQQTDSFSRRLEKYDLMAGQLKDDVGLKTLLETIESTVLNHKGNSLLFPFLIIEAKRGNGASFEDCNIQTALPILKMLKIQEDLQKKSQMALEYGGPLVWYIAYRGEDWRLSGCYISEKLGRPSYEIMTLWTGQLNDVESALQLLLIIDYIFDWARDIYKPSLNSQLKRLANEPPDDDDHIRNDSFSKIDTDSDIFSLARRARPERPRAIDDWGADVEHDTEITLDEERSLMNWATHDSKFGIFRPACTVQNLFRCLFVTKANIDALSSAVPQRCTEKQLAKEVMSVLDSYGTVLVSEDVLDTIEEVWTNRVRPNKPRHIPETRLFASIVYHTVLNYNWELQRIIYCLVLDVEALNKFKTYNILKRPPLPFTLAKRFGKGNAEALIRSLKNQSIQQNLASALATTTQELRPSAGTSSSSRCPTFEFLDITYRPNGWSEKKTYEVVNKVYTWCTKNFEEPTEPFLRVSHQWNTLAGSSTGSTIASYFPNSVPTTNEQYILASHQWPYESFARLCIYVIPGLTEDTEQLRETLRNAAETDVLYKCEPSPLSKVDDSSNNWKNVYKKWRTTDSGSYRGVDKQIEQWRRDLQDKVPPSLPVASPTVGKAGPRPVEHPSFPPHAQSSRPIPSHILIPPHPGMPVVEAESNLRRPHEDEDRDESPAIQKKARRQSVIIIDD